MRFLPDFSLAAFNTFGVAAQARRFALVANEHTLIEWCVANAGAEAPFLLGGGSNVLFTRDVEAPILQLALLGRRVVIDEGGAILSFSAAADELHLTEVDTEVEGAHAFFPAFDPAEWHEVAREPHPADAKHAIGFDFVEYRRV